MADPDFQFAFADRQRLDQPLTFTQGRAAIQERAGFSDQTLLLIGGGALALVILIALAR